MTGKPQYLRAATVAVVASAVFALTLVQPAAADSMAELVGIGTLESWEAQVDGEVHTARSLVLVEWLPDRELTLVLLELPGDQRLVLSRNWRIREGVSVLRISDDSTGWWAQMTERSALRYDAIDDIAKPALAAERWRAARDEPVRVELEGTGIGQDFTWSSRLDDSGFYPDLFEQLDAEGLATDLVAAMPAETRQAIRALDSLWAAKHQSGSLDRFQRLVELLTAALDRHDEPADGMPWSGLEWKLANRTGQTLRQPLAQASRDFADKFEQVSAEDPMARLRPPRTTKPSTQGSTP